MTTRSTRALAIIDGEHYAPVVQDALATLPYDFGGAWLVGGTEKLRGDDESPVRRPRAGTGRSRARSSSTSPTSRCSAARALSRRAAHGVPYVGPDFRFDPPSCSRSTCHRSSACGKRVGARLPATLRLFARPMWSSSRWAVGRLARGRIRGPTATSACSSFRDGRHAASDYLEDAVFGGVDAIGCRRVAAAGWPAECRRLQRCGRSAPSSRARARPRHLLRQRRSLSADCHRAADPRRQLEHRARAPGRLPEHLPRARLRSRRADGAPNWARHESPRGDRGGTTTTVIATEMLPRPVEPIEGGVAVFTTAGQETHERLKRLLADEHGAEIVHVSGNLAERGGAGRPGVDRRRDLLDRDQGSRNRRRRTRPSEASTACSSTTTWCRSTAASPTSTRSQGARRGGTEGARRMTGRRRSDPLRSEGTTLHRRA